MSKASVPEKPVEDNPRSYPWGENTGTYKLWLTLITINIIFISVIFLVDVEIPLIADLTNTTGIEKGSSGSLAVGNSTQGIIGSELETPGPVQAQPIDKLKEYGMYVIVANVILVWVTKTVGKWITVVEKWCRNLCKCKWYKPWCCLGRLFCWFVKVVKWVTWVISIASSVITSILVWVWSNSGGIQG